VRCRQPEKILLPPELAVLLAEPVELSALLAAEQTLVAVSDDNLVEGSRSTRAWRTQRARLLEGRPSRSATALQERPSCRQSSTASAFCCAVNRRLVLVGVVIDGQSGGHGVTLTDLSLKPWEPQCQKAAASLCVV
jgi:hypothetical protein